MISTVENPVAHPHRFFIDGEWVEPSSDATIEVLDSNTEEHYFSVAEASPQDMDRAITAARRAFDQTEWPFLSHQERAGYLRAMAAVLRERSEVLADLWSRESGTMHPVALTLGEAGATILESNADLADTYPWEEVAHTTTGGAFALVVREPVGVVGAIVPWNVPLNLALYKVAPALLAGCTVVLKASPEAPGSALIIAEAAERAGLPQGVLNVLTADREVSELMVRDPRIDKIAFTGSTAAGRRIAGIMADRIGRYTLELGGKSAAVILDDADLERAAARLAEAEWRVSGQVCSSLTRLIVTKNRAAQFSEVMADVFSRTRVGSSLDHSMQMGPLASDAQRKRVEGYIATGISEGAQLLTGGGRPAHLERGYFVEPTVFGGVDNNDTIAREEIFGPVLTIITADDEDDAIRIANDSIYGLNASVFTPDVDRARFVASRLRSGTVGHNALRTDFGISFGGFKQSGVGREGGKEGLAAYLETKTVILDDVPSGYRA